MLEEDLKRSKVLTEQTLMLGYVHEIGMRVVLEHQRRALGGTIKPTGWLIQQRSNVSALNHKECYS